MSEHVIKLKFRDKSDQQMYAVDEELLTIEEALVVDQPRLDDICEGIIKRRLIGRNKRRRRVKDHKRSRSMKKLWKSKRKNFEKGIKKFHKSIKGKRLHQKVARNRKDGKYRSIQEWYTGISSMLTHLAIEASYSSTINEEAEMELLWEEGNTLLLPILNEMATIDEAMDEEFDEDFNQYLASRHPQAALFIDDLIGLSDMHENCDPLVVRDLEDELVPADMAMDRDINETEKEGADDSGETSGKEYTKDKDDSASDKLTKSESEDGEPDRKDDPSDKKSDKADESYGTLIDELDEISESYTACPELDTHDDFQMITEAANDSDVDGENVIAKIVGPAFFPGRTSRNKVEYTMDLWKRCISRPEFRRELEARRIYGTFGHDLPIDDAAIRDGKIGQIISDVWIDESTGIGMAEYLILNTGPGRMIKTLFGAKSKVRVSTRARGKMLSQRFGGNKRPDPAKFFLRAIDFVHDPGFLDAEPTLADRKSVV